MFPFDYRCSKDSLQPNLQPDLPLLHFEKPIQFHDLKQVCYFTQLHKYII